MKAFLEDIKNEKSSFRAYRYQVPYFEFKWHYHPEYELTYIIKGKGFRLVGNCYENYEAGDLVLLGRNLPHTWCGKAEENAISEAIVIQFSQEFINCFLGFNESVVLQNMMENSNRGLVFETDNEINSEILILVEKKGFERVLQLLTILHKLSKRRMKMITKNTFYTINSKENEKRINKICLFLQNHFSEKLKIKQIADLVFMTESNFCKFFKKATGKTFSHYLNDIRVNEICRLLLQTEKTISMISEECGFETLSYFNRVFLLKKGMTPSEFRWRGTSKRSEQIEYSEQKKKLL